MEYTLTCEQAQQIKLTGNGILYDNLYFHLISNSLFMRDSDLPEGLKVYLNTDKDCRTILSAKFFVEGSENCYSNTVRTNKKKTNVLLAKKFTLSNK